MWDPNKKIGVLNDFDCKPGPHITCSSQTHHGRTHALSLSGTNAPPLHLLGYETLRFRPSLSPLFHYKRLRSSPSLLHSYYWQRRYLHPVILV
ncbi:hypothetical protein BDQ12DRAFT_690931, partial [Crucibulum laeve]